MAALAQAGPPRPVPGSRRQVAPQPRPRPAACASSRGSRADGSEHQARRWGQSWTLTAGITPLINSVSCKARTYELAPNSAVTMCYVSSRIFWAARYSLPKRVLYFSQRSQLSFIPLIQRFQRVREIFLFDSRAWISTGRDIKTEQGEFGYVALMQSDNWAVWSNIAKLTVSSIEFIYILCVGNLVQCYRILL